MIPTSSGSQTRGFPVSDNNNDDDDDEDDTTTRRRGKAQSGWQHGVYLLPVDLQPRGGVLARGKIFTSVISQSLLSRKAGKYQAAARYSTRRALNAFPTIFVTKVSDSRQITAG